MPQVFKIGDYLVYFWINEGRPLEPVHVHVSQGVPSANSTKIWLTRSGHALLANNNSQIPLHQLRIIIAIIEARHTEITDLWVSKFGVTSFYC